MVVFGYFSLSLSSLEKTINYYKNFVSFITGGKTVTSYQSFFDRRTPIDYEVAQFIKPKIGDKDSIFVWGNNAQLYKLVDVLPPGKYTVRYHMTFYTDGIVNTKNALLKVKPKFIVVMPKERQIPFSLINYTQRAIIKDVFVYERIF